MQKVGFRVKGSLGFMGSATPTPTVPLSDYDL